MTYDTSETVHITPLALLKMLKHARAGVPLEVMGLMLGEYVDDYTVRVVDVFAMPQSGSAVTVESVDPVYQTQYLEYVAQTGRPEVAVGWYHSHPGFGCWLSGVDVNTAASFEQLNSRSVAVVVDPIQSVKGKVVIDAFRTIPKEVLMTGAEPRQTTSHLGSLVKPSIVALVHGLNRSYYSLPISYRKNDLEVQMLSNLGRRKWSAGLSIVKPKSFVMKEDKKEEKKDEVKKDKVFTPLSPLDTIAALTTAYAKRVVEEEGKTAEQIALAAVGRMDPKKRLEAEVVGLIGANISGCLGAMIDTVVF